MATTERNYVSDWLVKIFDRDYNLETRVIEGLSSAAVLQSGEVLRLGTGVKLKPISVSTGADAIAILLDPVSVADNTADCNRLCLVRGPAVIISDELNYSESATQATQAIAALKVLNMIDKNQPTFDTQST